MSDHTIDVTLSGADDDAHSESGSSAPPHHGPALVTSAADQTAGGVELDRLEPNWVESEETETDEDAPATARSSPSHIRPTWSLRPTRWQLTRLQLGACGAAMAQVGALDVAGPVALPASIALALSALPWPATSRPRNRRMTQDAHLRHAPTRSGKQWLNPIDYLLRDLDIDDAPGLTGAPIGIANSDESWIATIDVASIDSDAPDSGARSLPSHDDARMLADTLITRDYRGAVVQLMLTVRDIPVSAVALPREKWVDGNGNAVRPIGGQDHFSIERCWVTVRLADRLGGKSPGIATASGSAALGTTRGDLRRLVLAIADDIAKLGFRADVLNPHRLRESLEISSAGPELSRGRSSSAAQPDDPPSESEAQPWRRHRGAPTSVENDEPSTWSFGDRHHVSYELRRCHTGQLGDLLDVLASTRTAAAVASLTFGTTGERHEVPPRVPSLACTVRLTDVEKEPLAVTCLDLEEALDGIGIGWHRLNGWHREGYFCSLPLGHRLPASSPRLAWRSVMGRRLRASRRQRIVDEPPS